MKYGDNAQKYTNCNEKKHVFFFEINSQCSFPFPKQKKEKKNDEPFSFSSLF